MRFALIAALLAGPCAAAPALTTIQDTLFKADGARFDGVAQIEWRTFQAADGSLVPQQALNVRVTSGNLRVSLVPTQNAMQHVLYTVKFNSNGRTQFVEYWSVPPSSTPIRLKDVRTTGQAGAIVSGPSSIVDITGLRSELDIRPAKGIGYLSSRAAVINASGALDAAIGNAGDCVHVDGTSGPCGGDSGSGVLFVDSEVPGGTVDGVNAAFTLAAAPTPPTSLSLFRNGLLLRQSVDYNLSGTTVNILAASRPMSGDVLQAWYRLAGTGNPTLQFHENETPGGIVDASNPTFTLAAAPVPASSLQLFRNGILMKVGLDYVLSGTTLTFLTGAIPQPGDVLQVSYRR